MSTIVALRITGILHAPFDWQDHTDALQCSAHLSKEHGPLPEQRRIRSILKVCHEEYKHRTEPDENTDIG
jgi:hypothetical protein